MLKDPFTVDPAKWTPQHTQLIKRAASYPEVDRIFVHPAIKRVGDTVLLLLNVGRGTAHNGDAKRFSPLGRGRAYAAKKSFNTAAAP
jgi:penicillin-insensitive murein endopeptidase